MAASKHRFVFPQWSNLLRPGIVIAGLGGLIYAAVIVYFGFSPKTTDVGYEPEQPIPYSHALHVGELGLDCRYCHNTVERAARAAIPPAQTCMNCHSMIKTTSPDLKLLRESYDKGVPIRWMRVHDLPDFSYFNHSAHISHGVGCETCHGRVDTMVKVRQAKPLSMGWCLDCHRSPAPNLRPKGAITAMDWVGETEGLMEEYHVKTSTDCATCHR